MYNWARSADTFINTKVDTISRGKTRSNQTRLENIEDQLDRLILVNRALWELLSEKTNLTDDELFSKVAEIDMRDGEMDGKLRKEMKKCRSCGRALNPRHQKCMYCGSESLKKDAFDAIK
ncbi:hypothetical protein [Sedimentisphaera salicampi]|uniref:hypothetical protein n=1 Tax=Sedimentisphaera salicampi TaxID=1941349 RepID=UPI000B9B38D8|nr:hypothetical protein [Sedimentisphaera salicampi]OXU15370.1 hypothetical protein SMSP1_00850 [Sedimentisphaera salicampi]